MKKTLNNIGFWLSVVGMLYLYGLLLTAMIPEPKDNSYFHVSKPYIGDDSRQR